MNNKTIFPDINLSLSGASSVRNICTNYINILTDSNYIPNIVYANKLQEYLDIDEKLAMFEDEFHKFKKFLREWSKNHIGISIKTRKKDFIGFNEKIRLFFPNLEKIHDLIGFRLILKTFSEDTEESVKLCYILLNDIIKFFIIERKYEFLVAEDLVGVDHFCPVQIPGIIIPSETNLILEGFENKVKDYIKNPKKDSKYQSLHFCVRTPSGLVFEVQIRTFAMDIRSDHKSYKKDRYPTHIDLDRTKIELPGIAFDNNGELISDSSGLLIGTDLFNNI